MLYVVVAGVIWNLFLTGRSMGYTPANMLLHLVVPLLAMTDWLLIGRDQAQVRWWQPFAWLAYPAAYLALALAGAQQCGPARALLLPGSRAASGRPRSSANVCLLACGLLGLGYRCW